MERTLKKTKPAKLGLTDRSCVKPSLRNSELRYRRLFETAQDGILILDAKTGAITDVNPYLIDLLGYSREEFIEKKLWEVGAFKDVQASKDAFEALQKNEYIRYENLPLKAKDGWLMQVEFVSNVYLVGEEQVIQCNIRDNTEHKRLVAALQENERKYRTLVTSSPDGTFLVDLSGNFSMVNQAMCEGLGFSEAEFRSMNIWDLVPDEYLDQYRERLAKILNGESLTEPLEYTVRGKDGRTLFIEVISAPYYSEKGVVGFQGIARDITARKRAEQTLRESEEHFQALIENASDLIVILNPDYTIAYVSPSVERILGYTVAAVTGAKIADFVEPQDLPNFIAATDFRSQTPGSSTSLMQVRVRHADGSWRTLEGIGSNLLDQPAVRGLVINARDITARKRAEEALRESERRFRNLADNSPDVIYVLDLVERRLVFFNREEFCGYSRQELESSNSILAAIHPDEQSAVSTHWQSLLTDDPAEARVIEYRLRRKEGDWEWIQSRETILERDKNDRPTQLLVTLTLITARKRAEEEIRRRANEFAALYDITRDLTAQQDVDAVINMIVRRATDLVVASSGAICLYDAARDDLVIAASKGPELPVGTRIKIGEGMAGIAAQTRAPIIVADYSQWEHHLPQFAKHQFGAGAAVPMLYAGTLIGTLNVLEAASSTREFTDVDTRLLTLFAGLAAAAVHNARLHEETMRQLDHLEALRSIDIAITASVDLQMTLSILLEHVKAQLNADAASVLLLNPHSQILEYAAGRGFRTRSAQTAHIRLGEDFAGRAALERRSVQADDPAQIQSSPHFAALWAGEDFAAYYGVPLISKGQVKGVLEVYHRAPFHPESDWISFLETFAGQAAIAIDSAQLFENLQRSNADLERAYDTTIEGWSKALDLRDRETEGHTQRVTEITLRLAKAMGIGDAELVHVRRGGLLHDIGKMGVPDSVLLKPGTLTDDEWRVMRQHPQLAYDMLSPIAYLKPALDIPYCHHEKWDGTGYPRGLKGEQIPLAARLFAVVDVWDALRSDRPYRQAWDEAKVREHIQSLAGTHFEPQVVQAFFGLMEQA